jgi:hypothetical protein
LLGRTGLALYGSDAQGNGLQAIVDSEGPDSGHVELFDAAGVQTFEAP